MEGEEEKRVGDKITKVIPPSRPGYDIIDEEQTIINDRGTTTFKGKVVKSEYRYEKRKSQLKCRLMEMNMRFISGQ